jgi:hypothetical protein
MAGGRPTKYEPRFCEEVIEAARKGHSLTGFAGEICVSRATITEWVANYPEFSAAVSCAKSIAAHSWEKRAINIGDGKGGPGAAGIVQFALKNLGSDDWKDVSTKELTGPNGGPVESVTRIERVVIEPSGE